MSKDSFPTSFSVRKSSGLLSPFDEAKLRRSLHRSGADRRLIEQVVQELHGRVYKDMSTKSLYKMAYKLLKKLSRPVAARYALKQAIMELGPSGYPFEYFVAELFKARGYAAKTGQILSGKCIRHEVDVVAEKGEETVLVECKYHAESGAVSDVKIPLYIHSRFRDITEAINGGQAGRKLQYYIATNTRFSEDAIRYGQCTDLQLIAWDYPSGRGLREMIDNAHLHPITCLSTLARHEKSALLDMGIVLCKSLLEMPYLLEKIGISPARRKNIHKELEGLCRHV